jgi:hypothetical protein
VPARLRCVKLLIFHLPVHWGPAEVLSLLAGCGLRDDAQAWPPRVDIHACGVQGDEAYALVQPLYNPQVARQVSDRLRGRRPGRRPLWPWRTVMRWV